MRVGAGERKKNDGWKKGKMELRSFGPQRKKSGPISSASFARKEKKIREQGRGMNTAGSGSSSPIRRWADVSPGHPWTQWGWNGTELEGATWWGLLAPQDKLRKGRGDGGGWSWWENIHCPPSTVHPDAPRSPCRLVLAWCCMAYVGEAELIKEHRDRSGKIKRWATLPARYRPTTRPLTLRQRSIRASTSTFTAVEETPVLPMVRPITSLPAPLTESNDL